MADPGRHHLVFICDLNSADAYQKTILDLIDREPWEGRVTVTGFLPAEDVGRILAAADAVVLPFGNGGGMWNTSIRAALKQGTFVLTTAREQHGYDSTENVYYARPDDVADMRDGLRTFMGHRRTNDVKEPASEWESIASAHIGLFSKVIGNLLASECDAFRSHCNLQTIPFFPPRFLENVIPQATDLTDK